MIRVYDEVGRNKIRKALEGSKLIADFGCGDDKIIGTADGYDMDINVKPDYVINFNDRFPSIKYDGICMSHFLEHVIDTRKFLNSCYECLNDYGVVSLIVPDGETVDSKTLGDSENTHEMLFTSKTLKSYLEHAGFEDVHVEYYSRPYAYNNTKGIFAYGRK